MASATKAAAEPIDGAGGGQPLEKGTPVLNRPLPGDLERSQKRFLNALVGVGPVANDSVGRSPHGRSIPGQDLIPVRHVPLLSSVDPIT